MGAIDWIPIAEMPEAFKDGRWVLLAGGRPDWADYMGSGSILTLPPAVTAFHNEDEWITSLAEACFVSVTYEDPTHFAEINGPEGG